MNPQLAIAIRIIVLAILAANIGVVGAVCWRYAQAWRRSPRSRRLKPAHVAAVSICTLGLEATLAWGQIDAVTGGAARATVATFVRTGLYGLFAIGLVVGIDLVRRWLARAGKPDGPPLPKDDA